MSVKELRGKLEERREKLAKVFEEAGDDLNMDEVKAIEGDSAAKVEQIRAINAEIEDFAKQLEEAEELGGIAQRAEELGELKDHPGHPAKGKQADRPEPQKDLGEEVAKALKARGEDAESFLSLKRNGVELPDISMKTLFDTTGWTVENVRTGRLVDLATRPIQVIDLIPSGATSGSAIKYMEETTFTNAAAEVAEGAAKPEATLALTERTEPVRKIAVWIPATDESLEDVPQVRGYLNNRLPFMVRQRLDGQIVVGDGTAPNLSGFLDRAIQTQAKGTDPTPDAVYKAMTKVRVTGRAMPSGAVFHPNDWQDVRLLRTADGIYIWGSPTEAGPERIWGLPVAQTDAITEGTALVGDFANFSELAIRSGIRVEVTNSHEDYFVKNIQVLLAEMRAALAVYRPTAFASVTGL